MIDIKDNILDEKVIEDLEWCLLSNTGIAWFIKGSNFEHNFWSGIEYSNRYNDVCQAWIDMYIKPKALIKVKGKLYPKSKKIKEWKMNPDVHWKHENCMTSILHINTNNGYTKFKNGEVVKSVRNRLVTFPAHLKHTGSTCTDKQYRCIINVNYYK